VLYEMLAGRVPFEADSTLSVIYMHINNTPPPIPGISPEVQAVLNRALAKNPNDRYQSSREMAIEFYLAIGMTAEAKTILQANVMTPEASAASIKPKPRRNQSWIGVGAVSLICLLALGVGAWQFLSGRASARSPTETVSPATTGPTEAIVLPVTGDPPEKESMVQVTSGLYEVGYSPADDYHSAPKTIELSDFWIDQFQTTNAQYQQYIAEVGAAPPQVWPGEADHPVRGVTWDEASAYCAWMNKRLPDEAEWEAAGRGSNVPPQIYPWGNDPSAEGQAIRLPDQDTYSVGSQSFNKSPFGVFDMVGNIWEWVGEPYGDVPAGYRILRGGRFGLPVLDLAYRLAVAPDDARYIKFAGFRCAADQVR
jgi:formylglycine-generating enzyme required for sulfatase activity